MVSVMAVSYINAGLICKCCHRRFVGGNHLTVNDIISDCVEHKLTLKELSVKYRKSVARYSLGSVMCV